MSSIPAVNNLQINQSETKKSEDQIKEIWDPPDIWSPESPAPPAVWIAFLKPIK